MTNYWEEDKALSASSKKSLTTRTQHKETSMDDLRVKQLTIHSRHTPSQHAERLLADYHKHLEHDSDCYIQEDDRSKKL